MKKILVSALAVSIAGLVGAPSANGGSYPTVKQSHDRVLRGTSHFGPTTVTDRSMASEDVPYFLIGFPCKGPIFGVKNRQTFLGLLCSLASKHTVFQYAFLSRALLWEAFPP